MSPLPEVRVVVLKRAPKPHQVLCTEFQPSWMTLHSGRAAGHAVLPSFLWDHVSGCGHPLCPPASAHCSSTVSFLLAGRPETPSPVLLVLLLHSTQLLLHLDQERPVNRVGSSNLSWSPVGHQGPECSVLIILAGRV